MSVPVPANTGKDLLVAILPSIIGSAPALVQAILAFWVANPAATDAQWSTFINALTARGDQTADEILAKIAADRAAHPAV